MSSDLRLEVIEKNFFRAIAFVRTLAERIWRSNRLFFVALTVMNLFLARRIVGGGIFADNDSVCHYAYLLHLADEFYPATGTFLGFSPKFNMGIPFLLYNTPPGIYVAAAFVAKVLHVAPLTGLKLCMVTAFCSVPLAGAAIARTFEDEPGDLPKFTALTFSLFSSELFGLEFYFKNGMLNPAFALPMLLGSLAMYREAQRRTAPSCLPYLAVGGFLFATTVMTHVLSAYMFCVALVAFTIGPGFRSLGKNAIKAGTLLAVGGLVAGEWLVPSMVFAAKEDAAYTWLRAPSEIWASFLKGETFSSYPVGFFPTFITQSSSSVVAMLAALIGLYYAIVKKNGGAISAFILFVLAFWIVLGPTYATGISILPVYDRLLWYRFVTLAAVGLFLLAGYGAWKFSASAFRYYPINLALLAAGAVWSFYVVTQRAVKVHTAAEFPQFLASVDHVSGWLRAHGDRRGRVFSEFLGQGVVQTPSVNYTRHMIPILSGFDEASGWIYENNPASQDLQKKGPFWYNPFPMIASAETYDVKYIVAGSPQFIHALSLDPRWKLVDATPDLELFEAQSFEASLLSRRDAKIAGEGYVKGGGYTYDVDLDASETATGNLVLKTNFAPAWKATMDGTAPLPLAPTAEGLLEIQLPKDLHGKHAIHLDWSITELRAKGHRLTLLGLALMATFFALARFAAAATLFSRIPSSLAAVAGTLGVVGAVVVLGWRARRLDLSPIGYGIRGGLAETVAPKALTVGSYYDDSSDGVVHLLDAAWGPRALEGSSSLRVLHAHASSCARLALSPGKNRLIVRSLSSFGGDTTFTATFTVPDTMTDTCTVHGDFSVPIDLPEACAAGGGSSKLPGVERGLTLDTSADVPITAIEVVNDTTIVEGESFQNEYDDGGYDAFYGIGGVERFAQNGVTMGGDALLEQPIVIKKQISLTPGSHYELWALTRVLHERFRATRATIFFDVDDKPTGILDGVSKYPVDFWDRDLRFEWDKVGEITARANIDLKVRFQKNVGAVGGLADVDAIAFVRVITQ